MKITLSIAFFLFFLGQCGMAGELHCEDLARLRALAKDCEDNAAYSNAGKACLAAYEKAVSDAKEQLARSLSALVSPDQQAKSQLNTQAGYKTAIASLQALEAVGQQLQREVRTFKQELVWPEDFASVTEAGMSAAVFLEGQSCYSSPQKLLSTYEEILGLQAKQLSLTAKIAESLAARARGRESQLKVEDILPMLTPKSDAKVLPSGVSNPPGPKAKQGTSDITGTEKIKKSP